MAAKEMPHQYAMRNYFLSFDTRDIVMIWPLICSFSISAFIKCIPNRIIYNDKFLNS